MMNITYGITKETYSLGKTTRVSYGVVAYADAGADGMATIIASVHDITSNRQSLFELVSLCNCLGLSTIHLMDIVEGFLEC